MPSALTFSASHLKVFRIHSLRFLPYKKFLPFEVLTCCLAIPSHPGEDNHHPFLSGWKADCVAQVSHPSENKERLCKHADVTAATASTRIETQIYTSCYGPTGSQNCTLLLKYKMNVQRYVPGIQI